MLTENNLVPGRNVTNGWTKGVLLSVAGGTARVALKDGSVREVEAATLRHSRGRPARLNPGALVRSEVDALIAGDASFVREGVALLFARQTSDEQIQRVTRWDNDLGFRADDARRGSALALKSACAWTDADYATGRRILRAYSGTQLFELAAEYVAEDRALAALTAAPSEAATLIAAIIAGTLVD
jgi:hypothetical protein